MRLISAVIAMALALASSASLAHHSGAMFDRAKVVTLNGTVKEFQFSSPHSWIRLMVLDSNGGIDEWDIEASGTARMIAWGIIPAVLKTGDKVTIREHPLRDGRKAGSLIDVRLADGRVLTTASDATAKPGESQ